MEYSAATTLVSGAKVHRPLMDETLTVEDLEKAMTELNETAQIRAECMAAFKEKLIRETDFHPRIDENYLIRFLRVRKFNVVAAYDCLRSHYLFRAQYQDCFPAPRMVKRVLEANIFNYLPHRDHMGRAIFIMKIANWNVDSISYDDLVAAGNLVSEYVLDNPVTQINGYIGIWDFSGFTTEHFLYFSPRRNLELLVDLMQDCFPGRFKMAYCLHCYSLFKALLFMIKPMLRRKFRNRVRVLGSDMSELHQYIDPSILPKEYGGSMPPSSGAEIARLVLDNEARFNYNRKFGFQQRQ